MDELKPIGDLIPNVLDKVISAQDIPKNNFYQKKLENHMKEVDYRNDDHDIDLNSGMSHDITNKELVFNNNIKVRSIDLPREIVKSNELCQAKIEIDNNVLANRIFYLLIANINSDDFPNVSLTSNLFDKGNIGGEFYREIKKATKILSKAQITKVFFDKNDNEKGFSFENIFITLKYDKGTIFGKFHPDIKPLLLDLKVKFTKLDINTILSFESYYSQRMYEVLSSVKYKGTVIFELPILQEMVAFPQKLRNDYSKFRVKVLEQAKNEIEKYTDICFEYLPIKAPGRAGKIIAVKFIFNDGLIDKRYIKNDKNYMYPADHMLFGLWKTDQKQLFNHYSMLLNTFTKNSALKIRIATMAVKLCFNMEKFIEDTKISFNTKPWIKRRNFNGYLITALQYKFGFKTPLENKRQPL
jgi:plasmid replication initiation protein